jgi:hypothetical protein
VLVGIPEQTACTETQVKAASVEKVLGASNLRAVVAPLLGLFLAAMVFMVVFFSATLLMSYLFGLDFAPVAF